MSDSNNEELNIIKSYSDIIFSADWRISPIEMPIEIFIEYLRRICMNNLHKEAHEYLQRRRVYYVDWDDFDEEEDEEGEATIRLNWLLLRQLEDLKNNGIKNVKMTDEVDTTLYEDEKDNFKTLFLEDVNFI
jgi:hypothetical protein